MLVSQRVSNRVMKDRSNIYMIYPEYKRFHNLEWYADNMMYDSMIRLVTMYLSIPRNQEKYLMFYCFSIVYLKCSNSILRRIAGRNVLRKSICKGNNKEAPLSKL